MVSPKEVRTIIYARGRSALSITGRATLSIMSCHCAISSTDPSPPVTACRSRRGEAPEGSSLFRPGVEARSAEDPGKEDLGKDIRPRQGVALSRQSVRHPSGVAGSLAMPNPRVFGATPLDPGLKSGHPRRGASFPTLHNELNRFCTTQMRPPLDIFPNPSLTGSDLLPVLGITKPGFSDH